MKDQCRITEQFEIHEFYDCELLLDQSLQAVRIMDLEKVG